MLRSAVFFCFLAAALAGSVTITQCTDNSCTAGCRNTTLPEPVCFQNGYGLKCAKNAVMISLTWYPSSKTCSAGGVNTLLISGRCDGEVGNFYRYTFLGGTKMQVEGNCTDNTCNTCISTIVDTSTCDTLAGASVLVTGLSFSNYVVSSAYPNQNCTGTSGSSMLIFDTACEVWAGTAGSFKYFC